MNVYDVTTNVRFVGLFSVILFSVTACSAAPEQTVRKERYPVTVIAHRGGSALAPENTLAAFKNAIALGADYVEVDTRQTKDGALVLMHDSKVDRTTNGNGAVSDMTLEEIRKLDAGSRFDPRFAGEKVPTFEEAVALCSGKIGIYLDHKAGDIPAICKILEKHGMAGRVVVYDGEEELREFKRLCPAVTLMPTLPDSFKHPGGIAKFVKTIDAGVLEGSLNGWNKALVDQAHAEGRKVFLDCLGLSDNPVGFKQAIEMGVDGIQTDRPDVLIRLLEDMKKP